MLKLIRRETMLGVAGVAGFIGGICAERKSNLSDYVNSILGHVDAAASFSNGSNIGKSSVIPIDSGVRISDGMDGKMAKSATFRVSEIMRYGFPSLHNIRSYEDFVLSYDQRNKVPYWVFEHLTYNNVKFNENVDRARCEFFEDSSVHPFFRSTNRDYKSSGYDRGHLAAAGNHKSNQFHCEQTFVLSNIAPQVGNGFNRDKWNDLEKHARSLTKKYDNVYVCSGPLYLPGTNEENGRKYIKYEVIGANNVAVPTHFFKVILCEKISSVIDLECYIMPNKVIDNGVPIYAFQVPLEAIERAAGLLFFDKLPKSSVRHINGRKSSFV